MIHRKCSNLTFTDIQKLHFSKDPFFCRKCIGENIPMHNVPTTDFGSWSSRGLNLDENLIGDTNYLNELFSPEDLDTDSDSAAHDSFDGNVEDNDALPEKYYCANEILLEDYDIKVSDFRGDNYFSSICMNIRSLSNTKHFAELQVFLKSLCFKPSVIAINETHLRDNDRGPHSNLHPDYEFISNSRLQKKWGGVGLYVLKSLNYEIREDLTIMEEGKFESLFIEVKGKYKSFLYGTIYRPPNDTNIVPYLAYLKKCLGIISRAKKPCIIQGDQNFDLIDTDDTNVNDFTDIMFDNLFYSHINKPTRVTKKTATCIDHIWSNIYDHDIFSGIITEKIADHMTTFQFSKLDIAVSKKSEKITFQKLDHNEFSKILNGENVDHILLCNDMDAAYEKFEECVLSAQEKSTTTKTIKNSRIDNKWFDRELLKLRKKRQRIYNRFKKDRSSENENAYKKINSRYEKLVITKKKRYLQEQFLKHKFDIRKTWGVMNDLLGRAKKANRIHSVNVDGKLETDNTKIANGFNKFFSSIQRNTTNNCKI